MTDATPPTPETETKLEIPSFLRQRTAIDTEDERSIVFLRRFTRDQAEDLLERADPDLVVCFDKRGAELLTGLPYSVAYVSEANEVSPGSPITSIGPNQSVDADGIRVSQLPGLSSPATGAQVMILGKGASEQRTPEDIQRTLIRQKPHLYVRADIMDSFTRIGAYNLCSITGAAHVLLKGDGSVRLVERIESWG